MDRILLFDMDGTLVDSAEGVYCSLRYAIDSVGGPPLAQEEVFHFMGDPMEDVLEHRYGYARQTALLVRERYMPHYQSTGLKCTLPVPGMTALTARLKNQGFRLAVATCKPWIYCGLTLELCGFTDCFEVVSGSGHNGVPEVKAAVIQEALRQMDAPTENALMIGDRAADVMGAKELGIPCVGVEFCGYAELGELEKAGAVAVVQTPEELEHFIKETFLDFERR